MEVEIKIWRPDYWAHEHFVTCNPHLFFEKFQGMINTTCGKLRAVHKADEPDRKVCGFN